MKNILITGGTGSVGQALIETFYNTNEYSITFSYNSNFERAKSISEKYHCKFIKIDSISNFNFDVVINCAGINISNGLTHEVDINDWNRTLDINLTLPFDICRKALPYMISKKWGRIINISSIFGVRSDETQIAYSVSKHGMKAITTTIAKEYAKHGITCNEICPGAIESEMMDRISDKVCKSEKEKKEYFDYVKSFIPNNKLALPKDIANAALFITENSHINGISLVVDGGETC